MKRLWCALLSVLLVSSFIPAPALAEALEEAGGVPAQEETLARQEQPTDADPGQGNPNALAENGDEPQDLQEDADPSSAGGADPSSAGGAEPANAGDGPALTAQNAGQEMGIWLKDLDDEYGSGNDLGVLMPMHRFEIHTSLDGWTNAGPVRFTPYTANGTPVNEGPYDVVVNADGASLDGLFYEDAESGLRLPLPEGYYTMAFTGTDGQTHATPVGEYSSYLGCCTGLYLVNAGDGFIFRDYYGMRGDAFARDAQSVHLAGTQDVLETVPLGGKLDLDFSVATATEMGATTAPSVCYLYMYKALDGNQQNFSLADLKQQYVAGTTGDWPGVGWWSTSRDFTGVEWVVWERTGSSAGSNSTTWSLAASQDNAKAGTLSIRNIDLSQKDGTNPALEPGVYFPVVRMKVGNKVYRYAYNPVEVARANTEQVAPTIRTDTVPDAMRGTSYSTTLAGQTGAAAGADPGTFGWAVTSGSLPAGLALDSATGRIYGTPTADSTGQTFTVTLTETIDGNAMTASKEYTMEVRDAVTLGTIAYPTDTIYIKNSTGATLHLSVPVSADLRDASLNLAQSDVLYSVYQTARNSGSSLPVGDTASIEQVYDAAKHTFEIDAPIAYDTVSVDRIEVKLRLRDNDGNEVQAPKEGDATGEGDWAIITSVVEEPNVTLGSYVRFGLLSYDVPAEDAPSEALIRLWPYVEGSTSIPADARRSVIDTRNVTDFQLEPGTYAFAIGGEVPLYDANGGVAGTRWVDLVKGVEDAQPIDGTNPVQYKIVVGNNDGTENLPRNINVSYTTANIAAKTSHGVKVQFEQEDHTYADEESQTYEARWYRRVDEGDPSKDVLVATGSNVQFGPAIHALYVEVVPTGRDAAFWKASERVRVAEDEAEPVVRVPRKQLFAGTFTLSCASGNAPEADAAWGIIEVQTPVSTGGYVSRNYWPTKNEASTVTIPDLTAGSVVTFTPRIELRGGTVGYTVSENYDSDFTAELVAPEPVGLITFESLTFTDVDGETTNMGFLDGSTEVVIRRLVPQNGGDPMKVAVPFYTADDSHLVLLPEENNDQCHFMRSENPTTYEVTVYRTSKDAPDRMGSTKVDYAVQKTYEVALSQNETTKTIEADSLTSCGYAVVPLHNPQQRACTLLLYNEFGDLVESGPAGNAEQLRTPFLGEGSYTLFAVDSDYMPQSPYMYQTKTELQSHVRANGADDVATSASLSVQTGMVTTLADGLTFPTRVSARLVDQAKSSVTVQNAYTDKLSVQMHAELSEGVTVGEGARLEISTNQPSRDAVEGYMNPKALNLNNVAIELNRWNNLFDQTQSMYNGSLVINLDEVKKTNAKCAEFPMDMTLIIPHTQWGYTEASVWLVVMQNGKEVRSLVGTYRSDARETTLTAPTVAAWKTFSVHGNTGPNALVTLFVNGMRAATTRSDAYGYYTAEITLPNEVEEFEEFQLTAMAQVAHGDEVYTSTSEQQSVVYSTWIPTVDRIFMCYQSKAGADYSAVLAYNRGAQPNKYLTLYRSENEKNEDASEDDRAKYFWVVEMANPEDLSKVTLSIPRSVDTVDCNTTDELSTASGWVPDIGAATDDDNFGYEALVKYGWTRFNAGPLARTALMANGSEEATTRAYVSRPVYLTYSPDDIEVNYELKDNISPDQDDWTRVLEEDEDFGVESVDDIGAFAPYGEGDREDLVGAFADMAQSQYLHACTSEDAVRLSGTISKETGLQLTSSEDMAQRLIANPNVTDEWLLLGAGNGDEDHEESLLKVRHQATTTSVTDAAIKSEVQGILDGAAPQVAICEEWLANGELPAGTTDAQLRYNGDTIAYAVSDPQYTEGYSNLLYVQTISDAGDVQIYMLDKYVIGDTRDHIYEYHHITKNSNTVVTLNERHNQRHEVTYTIGDDQLNAAGYDGEDGMGFYDVYAQWMAIVGSIHLGLNELVSEEEDPSLSGQSVEGQGDQSALHAQGAGSVAKGEVKGWLIEQAIDWIAKTLGIETKSSEEVVQEISEGQDDFKDLNKTINKNDGTVGRGKLRDARRWAANLGVNNAKQVATDPLMVEKTITDGKNKLAKNFTPSSKKKDVAKWQNKNKPPAPKPNKPTPVPENKPSPAEIEKIYKRFLLEMWKKRKTGSYNILFTYNLKPDTMDWFYKRAKHDLAKWEKIRANDPPVGHDPSGIVYEAVLSNPVEGATVTLYTYNNAAATAQLDPAQFMDSNLFGIEENPQVTGADGRYQWFVPEGYWQVRASKDGYQSVSTGQSSAFGIDATKELTVKGADGQPTTVTTAEYWMPVLPIQLDVNIPLVSKEAPVVESVEADELGVKVTFSKYMQPGTVTADLFAVDGQAVSQVEPLDAEAAGDGALDSLGNPVEYARSFRMAYPNGGRRTPGSDVKVGVAAAQTARSYANVALVTGKEEVVLVADTGAFQQVAPPEGASLTYNGAAQTGVASAAGYTLGGTTSATNAGTYAATATPAEGYAWSDGTREQKTITWSIAAADLSAAKIAPIKGRGYDGKPYEPEPKVTLGGRTLVEKTDYAVSYKNNVSASNGNPATLTVTGKGNYAGTATASFEVWKNGQPMTAWAVARSAPAASLKVRDVVVESPIHVAHAVSAAKPMEYRKVGGDSRLNVDLHTGRVTIRKGTPAGTHRVTIRAIAFGGSNYADGSRTVECSVRVVAGAKMDQSFQVTANDVVRTASSLALSDYLTRPFSTAMAAGNVTYKLASGSGRLSVDSAGRLKVAKGTKAGTYYAKVWATAAGDAGYKPCTRTVTVKVVVR